MPQTKKTQTRRDYLVIGYYAGGIEALDELAKYIKELREAIVADYQKKVA